MGTTITPDALRAMDVNEIIALIEQKLVKEISVDFAVRLAILHGLKGKPLPVIDPSPLATKPYVEETLDYAALARLLNQGTHSSSL